MIMKSEIEFLKNLIDKYTILYIKRDFLSNEIDRDINYSEVKKGLAISEIIIAYKDDNYIELVLKYATIIAAVISEQRILIRCNDILDKLTVFTFEEVLRNKKQYTREIVKKSMSYFQEKYNEINYSRQFGDEVIKLNKFQTELSDVMNKYKNISISASTSSGKSYLMKKNILNLLKKNESIKIIYVVPTRALINQVMIDIQNELKEAKLNEEVSLTCTSHIEIEKIKKKSIFVFTQERLNQFFWNEGMNFNIDVVIIDEAQEIGNGARGVLLEYTVKYIKNRWDNTKLIFVSPLIDNPEILVENLKLDKAYSKKENFRTVNQNLIFLKKIENKSSIQVEYNDKVISELEYKSTHFSKKAQKIAYIFKKFNNNENSIIFSKKQSDARKIALQIAKEYPFLEDAELNEFADYVKNYICEKYELVELIKKGIVYHHGKIPSIIRAGIEELANKGKFKVIVCTTTLLAGVNIQANNIYVYEAKKKNSDLTNLEFWNLVGRAGRMKYDICGNIILINLDSKDIFSSYDREKIGNLKFAKDVVMESELGELETYMKQGESNEFKGEKQLYDNIESTLIMEKLSKNESWVGLEKISDIIDSKIENNIVPPILLKKLIGVRISKMNLLWNEFECTENIDECILINPLVENSWDRLIRVLKIINRIFLDSKYSDKKIRFWGAIMMQWMKEEKLGKIFFKNFDLNAATKITINEKIQDGLNTLNTEIRYTISKYIYAYQEVLGEYLKFNNMEEKLSKMSNYPLYLEFGATNKKVLELMYMGFIRESAIILVDYIKSDEQDSIRKELGQLDIEAISCNKYMKKKLKEQIRIL